MVFSFLFFFTPDISDTNTGYEILAFDVKLLLFGFLFSPDHNFGFLNVKRVISNNTACTGISRLGADIKAD